MSIPEIEIIRSYKSRIDFECSYDDLKKIEDKAFKWCPQTGDLSSFQGNAACHPYVQIESMSIADVQEWRDKVCRYMNRFKSVRFI